MEFGQHAKFAAHVVRALDLASERRAPEHHFATTELDGIGEIRMAAWVLPNDQGPCLVRKMAAQERFELREVKLLAGPDGSCLILEPSHTFSQPRVYLYVSNVGSSKCWNELKVLSVNRLRENKNSL